MTKKIQKTSKLFRNIADNCCTIVDLSLLIIIAYSFLNEVLIFISETLTFVSLANA